MKAVCYIALLAYSSDHLIYCNEVSLDGLCVSTTASPLRFTPRSRWGISSPCCTVYCERNLRFYKAEQTVMMMWSALQHNTVQRISLSHLFISFICDARVIKFGLLKTWSGGGTTAPLKLAVLIVEIVHVNLSKSNFQWADLVCFCLQKWIIRNPFSCR